MKKLLSLGVASIVLAVALCFTAMPLIKAVSADMGNMKGCAGATHGDSDAPMKSCQHDAKNQAQFQGQLVIVKNINAAIIHDFFRSILETSLVPSYEGNFLMSQAAASPEIPRNDYLAHSTTVVIRT